MMTINIRVPLEETASKNGRTFYIAKLILRNGSRHLMEGICLVKVVTKRHGVSAIIDTSLRSLPPPLPTPSPPLRPMSPRQDVRQNMDGHRNGFLVGV